MWCFASAHNSSTSLWIDPAVTRSDHVYSHVSPDTWVTLVLILALKAPGTVNLTQL